MKFAFRQEYEVCAGWYGMVCCGMYGMVGFGCDMRCDGADGLAGLSTDAPLALVPVGCS